MPNKLALLVLALALGFSGAANATPLWMNGDVITNPQSNWSDITTTAGQLLASDFTSIYASVGGGLLAGLASSPGVYMLFGDSFSVQAYLPASGTPGPLTASLINPTTSPSGAFGGEVIALKLNIDFNDAGWLLGTTGIPLGNLVLENFGPLSLLNGRTIRQVLSAANTDLGGGTSIFSIGDLYSLLVDINTSFQNGIPSAFAEDHLVSPTSAPASVPEPATLTLCALGLAGAMLQRRRRS
jgi:uncharacterized protein (TIGR03382 family)